MRASLEEGNITGGITLEEYGSLVVQKEELRRFFSYLLKKETKTLENILRAQINLYTIIYSDCWKAYNNLKNIFFAHKTVNHSKEFMNKKENVHTNTIKSTWNAIKRNIPFRNRTKKLFTIYLLRFMLCRNNENSEVSELLYCSLSYKY